MECSLQTAQVPHHPSLSPLASPFKHHVGACERLWAHVQVALDRGASALTGTEIGACLDLAALLLTWRLRCVSTRWWIAVLAVLASTVLGRLVLGDDDGVVDEDSMVDAAADSLVGAFWQGPAVQA